MIGAVAERTGVLRRLHQVIELEEDALSCALIRESDQLEEREVFADLVAAGTRLQGPPEDYAVLIESIFEGYLVHYGSSRLLVEPDADLRLLAGDYLYAYGLSQLAALGDLESVKELADLISLCARAHSGGSDGRAPEPWLVTGGLWSLSALAIATGSWREHDEVKRHARAGDAAPDGQILDVARRRAGEVGLRSQLEHALIAFAGAVPVHETAMQQP